jgi:hypothetical protein
MRIDTGTFAPASAWSPGLWLYFPPPLFPPAPWAALIDHATVMAPTLTQAVPATSEPVGAIRASRRRSIQPRHVSKTGWTGSQRLSSGRLASSVACTPELGRNRFCWDHSFQQRPQQAKQLILTIKDTLCFRTGLVVQLGAPKTHGPLETSRFCHVNAREHSLNNLHLCSTMSVGIQDERLRQSTTPCCAMFRPGCGHLHDGVIHRDLLLSSIMCSLEYTLLSSSCDDDTASAQRSLSRSRSLARGQPWIACCITG